MKSNPAFLFSGSEGYSSILGRFSPSTPPLNPLQNTIDTSVSNFVEDATDWKSIAAMTVGGLAYRWGKMGVMGLNVGAMGQLPVRAASLAFGLGAEVTAFEFTNRFLHTIQATGQSPLQAQKSNPWAWSGTAGLKQGLLTSLITFGTLKGSGKLAETENLILQHASQDLAMVFGHQLSYPHGWERKIEEPLAEQLLQAEATLWQMNAGLALGQKLTSGKVLTLEKGLDLSLTSKERVDPIVEPMPVLGRQLALVTTGPREKIKFKFENKPIFPFNFALASSKEGGGGSLPQGAYPYHQKRNFHDLVTGIP
jgi:hypothetical protein